MSDVDVAFFYQEHVPINEGYIFRSVIITKKGDEKTKERSCYAQVFTDLFNWSVEHRCFLRECNNDQDKQFARYVMGL
jgi:hypothetical protein